MSALSLQYIYIYIYNIDITIIADSDGKMLSFQQLLYCLKIDGQYNNNVTLSIHRNPTHTIAHVVDYIILSYTSGSQTISILCSRSL